MATTRSTSVRVKGLNDLQRSFKKISGGTGPEIRRRLLIIAGKAATDARGKLISRSKNPRGRIDSTIRPFVRQKGAGFYSRHPGAGVIEWGGTISPRGTPITIKGKHALVDAAEERMLQTEHELGDMIDDLARGAGFH